jgi:hypothetical protein
MKEERGDIDKRSKGQRPRSVSDVSDFLRKRFANSANATDSIANSAIAKIVNVWWR